MAEIKIVCLAQESPPINWFVNRLHEEHPISLLVVEHRAHGGGTLKKLGRLDIGAAIWGIEQYMESRMRKREGAEICDQILGDGWQEVDNSIPSLVVDNINSSEVSKTLGKLSPDVIVVHGTSLVKDSIIDTAFIALNLHWGLSPYYRGGRCTEWALLLWDPLSIGVTIHRLDNRIDGGDVVAQARAEVTARDSVSSINLQLSKLGSSLMTEALDRLASGSELEFHAQDFSSGLLFNSPQWNRHVYRQIRYIENHGLLKKMLDRPARRTPPPIIEFRD